MENKKLNKNDIIKKLKLTEHIEGGYFVRTYCSSLVTLTDRTPAQRPLLTSIYYLLTDDRPIGHFHLNKSDIIHYFHSGSPINYFIISPDGKLETITMGNDIANNQFPQMLVKGGYWKASVLTSGEYGLISEAVSPGFDYQDMKIGTRDILENIFPELWDKIADYVK